MKGDQFRRATRNILAVYRAAPPEVVVAGTQWYPEAHWVTKEIGRLHDYGLEHSVVALAHLSPRVSWSQNLRLLEALLAGQEKPRAALTRSWDAAARSLGFDHPLDSFGRRADKTRAFAQAIIGDHNAVVVDTWAARVAGLDQASIRGRTAYQQIADSYRRAARIAGISPRTMQAVTWVAIRGSHL